MSIAIGLLVGYAVMIIRKIIMTNYDEPAKTSVGEVARYMDMEERKGRAAV